MMDDEHRKRDSAENGTHAPLIIGLYFIMALVILPVMDLAVADEKPARADEKNNNISFLVLPAVSYVRNQNYWTGILIPILKRNPRDEIEDLVVPMYLHNRFIGERFSLNYYGYRDHSVQYRAAASYATEVEHKVRLGYENSEISGGRFLLEADAAWFKNPFSRFFGLGGDSSRDDETNYTSREGLIRLTAGVRTWADTYVLYTQRYRSVKVEDGVVPSLPQIGTLFPTVTGLDGAQILGQRVAFRYDTRDSPLTPTKGTTAELYGELNTNLIHEKSDRWFRYGLDARHLILHDDGSAVLAVRFLMEAVNGRNVPFYERPTLGGQDTLRAFGKNRFIDDALILFNIEERFRITKRRILGNPVEVELATFLDIGQVMDDFESIRLHEFQFNPGFGIRLLARPHVTGRLDVAYGKDGFGVFVGLDYPF
jgi:hypothetical protein